MSQGADPILVGEIELGTPEGFSRVSPRTGIRYERATVLVRLHGVPLGFIRLALREDDLDPAIVRRAAWRDLADPIRRHLTRDGLPIPEDAVAEGSWGTGACRDAAETTWHEPITVVVCTRDRPTQLAGCLLPLQQLRYPSFEVVVVDNAPSNDEAASHFTDAVGDDPRFRYVMEPRPGLSRARNRGMAEATYQHVAYTDDDELVDPLWLEGIARGFSRDPSAGCVTGLVPSAQLDTPFQIYFDQRVWWSSGLEPHIYDLAQSDDESPMFPFDAGKFGTGGNFAVDRKLMQAIGGFDQGLGPGAPTGGADDLDAFVRVLRAGRSVVYEPSAIAWHLHRATFDDLREQLFGYGLGLSAYITKYLADPVTRGQLLRRVPSGLAHMLSLWGRPDEDAMGKHRSLVIAEARGLFAGPFAYWKARRTGWSGPR